MCDGAEAHADRSPVCFVAFCGHVSVYRAKPVPRRLHCRREPRVRGRAETVVYIYSGAAADVAGVLQSMQERPQLGRESRGPNTSKLVGSHKRADSAEYTKLEEGPNLKPRTGVAGCPIDVGASNGGFGAE